ncbi:hypothetical protein [Streptomyces sp. MUM 178J]|uniref:hypothetical protein n=1 Tax=Streptomyces sp. MUM 178J TaxID=2791991 RepID=UPI001F0441CF|nr:hypothetical protein [Streptomyces sp. MUM 178J]WRQ80638.1 hypothetical protein I3F59_015435 [Streptomyces sp. MUM 178J]
MSDEHDTAAAPDEGGRGDDGRDQGQDHREEGRTGDRRDDRRDGRRGDGREPASADAEDGPERQPEPDPFQQAVRSRPGGAGGTGGAGTAHAARRTFAQARDVGCRVDIGGDGQIFEGNYFINQFARDAAPALVHGAVPHEALRDLDAVYCEVTGYQRMKQLLRADGLLVLCGEPGSGRKATALALLSELADHRVTRLDPSCRLHRIDDHMLESGAGHLLELPPDGDWSSDEAEHTPERGGRSGEDHSGPPGPARLSELHLDRFSTQLRASRAYGVVLVESGDLADRLLRGRYGVYCPPAPAAEVLGRHLRMLLKDEPDGALQHALETAARDDVRAALGLDELRPREAARLAGLLARREKDELTHEQLLGECAAFVRAQTRSWFAGADRPGTVPEALPALSAAAFRIAVAAFNGSAYSLTSEAAELLAWELSVTLHPGEAVGRRLFGTHAEIRPMVARAVLEDGELDLGDAAVPVTAIRFQGEGLATAVLREVWHGYHNARGPMARWLRMLCDDPRPQVWVRAAIAAGVLCSWDWIHGYGELIRPMALTDSPTTRMAAATALAEAARDSAVQPAVKALLKQWAQSDDEALLTTAVMAHGYGLPAGSVRASLDALAKAVRSDEDGAALAAASFSVVRLLASDEPETVVRRLGAWLRDGRRELANLVLLSVIGAVDVRTTYLWGLTDVPALEPHRSRPLLTALLAARPELTEPLAALVRRTLSVARSGEAALEAFGGLLRRAAEDDEVALEAVCGLLPLLGAQRRDRDRLRGLLEELVKDRDDPMDKSAAGRMWDAVGEGADR